MRVAVAIVPITLRMKLAVALCLFAPFASNGLVHSMGGAGFQPMGGAGFQPMGGAGFQPMGGAGFQPARRAGGPPHPWLLAFLTQVDDAEPTRAIRGMATEVEVHYAARLRPRADQTPLSPVLVRVNAAQGSSGQRIEFVGNVVGDYDLRDFLEREDGTPPSDLPPLIVTVITQLPPDHGTDLYSSGTVWFDWSAHYSLLLWLAVGVWAAVPVAWLVHRAMRKKAPVAPPPVAAAPETLEDQLRAALAAAASRPLSTQEKARLELLVFRFFGERLNRPFLGTTEDMAETLRAVRLNAETRDLVGAIERWLHAYGSDEADRRRAADALEDFRRSRLSQPSATSLAAGAPVTVVAPPAPQEESGRRPVPRGDHGGGA